MWLRSLVGLGAFGSLPEPELIVLVGAPGSGKSTLARQLVAVGRADKVLSSDAFAAAISGDPGDQDCRAQAFHNLHEALATELAAGRRVVVDATSVRTEHRLSLVRIACRTGVGRRSAYLVRTPLATCLERNAARPDRLPEQKFGPRVPPARLAELHALAEQTTPAILASETFRPVYVISTKRTRA